MNILITGGAGFIGSNLTLRMVAKRPEDNFVVLDQLTYAGNLANLEDIRGAANFTFVKGDICDGELVTRLLREHKIQVIAHLAAESHVDRSIESAAEFIRTNIVGTQTLLEAALAQGVEKFVQISTDEVYGTLSPDDPPFRESTPIAPNSPYAASKASADLLVRAYVETHGLPAMITRCSNNYGPFQFPEKLIPLMLTNALEGKPLPVYGDGRQVRDWIHVEDHNRGVEMVIDKGEPGEIYNLGGAAELANIDLLKKLLTCLAAETGTKVEEYLSLITHVEDRLGHDRRYAMDFEETTRRLGWRPKWSVEEGLAETVRWYLAHEDWWRSVKSGAYLDYYEQMYGGRSRLD